MLTTLHFISGALWPPSSAAFQPQIPELGRWCVSFQLPTLFFFLYPKRYFQKQWTALPFHLFFGGGGLRGSRWYKVGNKQQWEGSSWRWGRGQLWGREDNTEGGRREREDNTEGRGQGTNRTRKLVWWLSRNHGISYLHNTCYIYTYIMCILKDVKPLGLTMLHSRTID